MQTDPSRVYIVVRKVSHEQTERSLRPALTQAQDSDRRIVRLSSHDLYAKGFTALVVQNTGHKFSAVFVL